MTRYARFATTLGPVFATADERGITGIYFVGQRHAPAIGRDWLEDSRDATLTECARQLNEYFSGKRRGFELPLAPQGSAFQSRV